MWNLAKIRNMDKLLCSHLTSAKHQTPALHSAKYNFGLGKQVETSRQGRWREFNENETFSACPPVKGPRLRDKCNQEQFLRMLVSIRKG